MTQDEFIAKAREVHGDKYDYSQVVYTGSQCKVTIVCPIHGAFEQRASAHLQGSGCKFCAAARTAKTRDTSHREERFRATVQERYGVDHPMHSKEFVDKAVQVRHDALVAKQTVDGAHDVDVVEDTDDEEFEGSCAGRYGAYHLMVPRHHEQRAVGAPVRRVGIEPVAVENVVFPSSDDVAPRARLHGKRDFSAEKARRAAKFAEAKAAKQARKSR